MAVISGPITDLFERDLNKLKEEINSYKNESDLWMISGEIKNSPGNLAIHLVGSLNFFIGTNLGKTGYVRQRDKEFSDKNISRELITVSIDEVIGMIKKTLGSMSDEKMTEEFPIEFLGKMRTNLDVLFIAFGHLNYHLGQINYHRRLLQS